MDVVSMKIVCDALFLEAAPRPGRYITIPYGPSDIHAMRIFSRPSFFSLRVN